MTQEFIQNLLDVFAGTFKFEMDEAGTVGDEARKLVAGSKLIEKGPKADALNHTPDSDLPTFHPTFSPGKPRPATRQKKLGD